MDDALVDTGVKPPQGRAVGQNKDTSVGPPITPEQVAPVEDATALNAAAVDENTPEKKGAALPLHALPTYFCVQHKGPAGVNTVLTGCQRLLPAAGTGTDCVLPPGDKFCQSCNPTSLGFPGDPEIWMAWCSTECPGADWDRAWSTRCPNCAFYGDGLYWVCYWCAPSPYGQNRNEGETPQYVVPDGKCCQPSDCPAATPDCCDNDCVVMRVGAVVSMCGRVDVCCAASCGLAASHSLAPGPARSCSPSPVRLAGPADG